MAALTLTLAEKIERSLDGRKQNWVVNKLNEVLPDEDKITVVQFSNCKNGNNTFTEKQLAALSNLLGTSFSND